MKQKRIKKWVRIVFPIVLYVFSVMSVSADASTEMVLDNLSGVNYAAYEEANAELVKQGQVARNARGFKYLTEVPHYFQDGRSWSNDIMQTEGLTIGSAGCCLTSFTMINEYLGSSDNPGEVNSTLGNSACPFVYQDAADKYGLRISNIKYGTVTNDYAINFCIGAVTGEYPVLVGMIKSSGGTHFVAAYGYNGSTVYIHDPASSRNYTTLQEYLDAGYSVHRLCVYN